MKEHVFLADAQSKNFRRLQTIRPQLYRTFQNLQKGSVILLIYTFEVSSSFSRASTIAGTLLLVSGCASCIPVDKSTIVILIR